MDGQRGKWFTLLLRTAMVALCGTKDFPPANTSISRGCMPCMHTMYPNTNTFLLKGNLEIQPAIRLWKVAASQEVVMRQQFPTASSDSGSGSGRHSPVAQKSEKERAMNHHCWFAQRCIWELHPSSPFCCVLQQYLFPLLLLLMMISPSPPQQHHLLLVCCSHLLEVWWCCWKKTSTLVMWAMSCFDHNWWLANIPQGVVLEAANLLKPKPKEGSLDDCGRQKS